MKELLKKIFRFFEPANKDEGPGRFYCGYDCKACGDYPDDESCESEPDEDDYDCYQDCRCQSLCDNCGNRLPCSERDTHDCDNCGRSLESEEGPRGFVPTLYANGQLVDDSVYSEKTKKHLAEYWATTENLPSTFRESVELIQAVKYIQAERQAREQERLKTLYPISDEDFQRQQAKVTERIIEEKSYTEGGKTIKAVCREYTKTIRRVDLSSSSRIAPTWADEFEKDPNATVFYAESCDEAYAMNRRTLTIGPL